MRKFAILLVVLAGCGAREDAELARQEAAMEREASRIREADRKQYEQQFQQLFADLTRATSRAKSVTVYEIANALDADYEPVAAAAKARVANYPVRAKHAIAAKDAGALVRTLSDRGTYFEYGNGWTCLFEPHHVLEVDDGPRRVTVVICVSCGDVEFVDSGGKVQLKSSVRPEPNGKLADEIERLSAMSRRP